MRGDVPVVNKDGFAEEREVRFISPMINGGDEQIRYRAGMSALIPYVNFRLAETAADLSIHEIMVGPSPTQQLTRSALVGLVKQGQMREPCIISCSQIPYREL